MMTDPREVLSALIDGEPVDADAVAQLLDVPANRALLVEFIRLRRSVQEDEETAPAWRADNIVHLEAARGSRRRAPVRAAAALVLLSAGALAGTWAHDLFTRERPPEPTRVVQLELVDAR